MGTELLVEMVAVFLAALGLLKVYVRYASRRGILDIPNERSSHVRHTPRGGGIIFAPALLIFSIWFPALRVVALWSLPIALVGFIDDLRGVSVPIRLGVQGIAALGVLLSSPEIHFPESVAWIIVSACWIIFATNTFNFIDGIDGILAGMGLTGSIWLCLVFFRQGSPVAVYFALLIPLLAAFLVFNWRPAKVFMGDVGSAFLGFSLSAASIPCSYRPLGNLIVFVVVFSPLLGDASLTLIYRLMAGENIFQAHRSHAYQRLSVALRDHASVALLYSAYTLLVSGPAAYFLYLEKISSAAALLIAYVPIAVLFAVTRTDRIQGWVRASG